jgi:hypothetical protein
VGVVIAVLGSTPFLLVGILKPEGETSEAFDALLGLGWALGGVLMVGGLLVATLASVFRHHSL